MHVLTTILGLAVAGLVAAAPFAERDDFPVTCNSVSYRIQQTNTCTRNYVACPQGPGVTATGVPYRGTYLIPGTRECAQCPVGAWGCTSDTSVIGCSEDGYVQLTNSGGLCYPNEACTIGKWGYIRRDRQTQPVRDYRRCQVCSPGYSAYLSEYECTKCPAELGAANRCSATKAVSCKSGFVLYEDKCLSTTCPSGWYDDNGVCKTCVSQDPKSVTCELGKSLTCMRNQLLVLSNNRCGNSACPYTPANGLPGSYRDGLVCRSCAPEAFNCDANGALNCYNPNGVQYYRLDRTCVSEADCLAAKPTSRLFKQLQSSTGVTYGTC
ncbi:hypothetical protein JCM11251_000655 [Rhodosporidiobolus azoricus]